ncbi:unnamed protein product [Colias eurytheme]|nr:unnamed protein product [Colias eurytheme]
MQGDNRHTQSQEDGKIDSAVRSGAGRAAEGGARAPRSYVAGRGGRCGGGKGGQEGGTPQAAECGAFLEQWCMLVRNDVVRK